jgi:hypothetical protein
VKKRTLVLVSTILLATSCKKSGDAGAGGAASGAPAQAAAPGSLTGFEGDLTIQAKSAKERRAIPPITMTVKGTKMRFDIPEGMENAPHMGAGKNYAIVDAPAKKLYTVVDEQKMVMVMDLEKLGEQMKKMKVPGAPAEPASGGAPPKVTKTGHNDTVAGISCEDWDITNAKGERGRVCVSNEGASWLEMPTIGLPSENLWARELFDGRHLPLRMVGYDASGAEESRLEVTKIERKPVADSTFGIPAGYREMDFSQMMAGVQGMMAGMMGGAHRPGAGMPMGMPSGLALPPGMAMPSALTLPNGVKLPKEAEEALKQLQERAKAAGMKPPQ